MKLGTARILVWSLMAAVILTGLIALVTQSLIACALTALALIAEVIVFYVFLKCPHCGHHLDRSGMNPDIEYCPFCGRSLKDQQN